MAELGQKEYDELAKQYLSEQERQQQALEEQVALRKQRKEEQERQQERERQEEEERERQRLEALIEKQKQAREKYQELRAGI